MQHEKKTCDRASAWAQREDKEGKQAIRRRAHTTGGLVLSFKELRQVTRSGRLEASYSTGNRVCTESMGSQRRESR